MTQITDEEIIWQNARRRYKSSNFSDRTNMLLISQVQRSGGSLLIQLLDGHPELFVHPSELHIGRPSKYHWPKLDLAKKPNELFDNLVENSLLLATKYGYAKNGIAKNDPLQILYLPDLHRRLFDENIRQIQNQDVQQRHILQIFFKCFFASWLDYQTTTRSASEAKFMASHVARLIMFDTEIDGYFNDFQKGAIVSIIREPVSWYASASNYRPDLYGDLPTAMDIYQKCLEETLARKKLKQRLLLVCFEDLVTNPLKTLNRLEKKLGLSTSSSAVPTFNGWPIQSNSSFERRSGIVDEATANRGDKIDKAIKGSLMARLGHLHQEALSFCMKL